MNLPHEVKRAVCVGCNYPSKPYGLAGSVALARFCCKGHGLTWHVPSTHICGRPQPEQLETSLAWQVNDAFLIAEHLEEHLGFAKENARA